MGTSNQGEKSAMQFNQTRKSFYSRLNLYDLTVIASGLLVLVYLLAGAFVKGG